MGIDDDEGRRYCGRWTMKVVDYVSDESCRRVEDNLFWLSANVWAHNLSPDKRFLL
jgi:hypothetical protein